MTNMSFIWRDRLRECSGDAARLLHERAPAAPKSPPPVETVTPEPTPGKRTISKESKRTTTAQLTEALGELRRIADAHPKAEIDISWEIRE